MSGRLSWEHLLHICLYSLPTPGVQMSVIKRHIDHPRCKTKKCGCSVVAHLYETVAMS